MNTLIEKYNIAYKGIVEEFTRRWMGDDIEKDEDITQFYYIIGGMIGHLAPSVVTINEEFYFDITTIYEIIKHNIPMNIVYDWYDKSLTAIMEKQKGFPNLYNYWRMQVIPPNTLREEKEKIIETAKNNLSQSIELFYEELGLSKQKATEAYNKIINNHD